MVPADRSHVQSCARRHLKRLSAASTARLAADLSVLLCSIRPAVLWDYTACEQQEEGITLPPQAFLGALYLDQQPHGLGAVKAFTGTMLFTLTRRFVEERRWMDPKARLYRARAMMSSLISSSKRRCCGTCGTARAPSACKPSSLVLALSWITRMMMVPRSTNPDQLANIAALVPPAEIESGGNYPCEVGVEVEDVAINYKVKMKVAYYGASFRSKIQQSLAKRTKPFAQGRKVPPGFLFKNHIIKESQTSNISYRLSFSSLVI